MSCRPVTFESNRDVRFEFESNIEASQVPNVAGKRKYTPCLKNCAFLFLSELRQIYTNFNMFLQVDGKAAEIVWRLNIFHLTWTTLPPYLVKVRCFVLHNVEMYYLQQTIWRLIISCHDRSAQNCQNSCSKCAPRTWTQVHRRQRVSCVSLSRSTVLCSRCAGATSCWNTKKTRSETTCACLIRKLSRQYALFTLTPNLNNL